MTSLDGAYTLAENLRNLVANHCFSYVEKNLTISFGVAQLRSDDDKDTFFKQADEALYRAKRLGRNRVEMSRK